MATEALLPEPAEITPGLPEQVEPADLETLSQALAAGLPLAGPLRRPYL
jgi:hypothetical protein